MSAGNPFRIGGPVAPAAFLGRASELNRALSQILNAGHLAIYGGPGMGKGSLLNCLAAPATWQAKGKDPAQMLVVRCNCRDDVAFPFQPAAFWRTVLTRLHAACQSDAALGQTVLTALQASTPDHAHLRQCLHQIGQQGKAVLLLLDDYDAALQTHPQYTEAEMLNLLFGCRSLSQEPHLSMVVATTRRLTELGPTNLPAGSPWYNHYMFLPLKPFTVPDVTALLSLLP